MVLFKALMCGLIFFIICILSNTIDSQQSRLDLLEENTSRDVNSVYSNLSDVPISEVSIQPHYICGNVSTGYSDHDWYGSCVSSCQSTKNSEKVRVRVWRESSLVGTTRYHSVNVLKVDKRSHVDVFGNCVIDIISQAPYIPTNSEISNWVDRLIKDDINNLDSALFMEPPACNYFSDEYNSGYQLSITHKTIDVFTDSYNTHYIIDTFSGNPISMGFPFYHIGSRWTFWTDTDISSESDCYFKLDDEVDCDRDLITNVTVCANGKYVFNFDVQKSFTSDCVGRLIISSDGTIYSIVSNTSLSDQKRSLIQGNIHDSDSKIDELITNINQVLSSLEETYCRSTCDIIEALFHDGKTSSELLETPIGPWYSFQKGLEMEVVPCKLETNLVIYDPIEFCSESQSILVQSSDTKKLYWWDISKIYAIEGVTCINGSNTPTVSQLSAMGDKEDLEFRFWSGTYKLEYPYNETNNWKKVHNLPTRKNSKWFGSIHYLLTNKTITFENVSSAIQNLTHTWHQLVDNGTKPHGENTGESVFAVIKSIENVVKVGVSSVWGIMTLFIKYRAICVDIVVTIIVIALVSWILKLMLSVVNIGRLIHLRASTGSRINHSEEQSRNMLDPTRT